PLYQMGVSTQSCRAGTRAGRMHGLRRRVFIAPLLAAATASGAFAADPGVTGSIATGSTSGLPVPRFVSLKPGKVNRGAAPTKDNVVTWVDTGAGLPVEVTAEYENWRRVRDWEGAEGWFYHSLLSGRRTAIVIPQANAKDAPLPLHADSDGRSRVVARLQA